MTRPIDIVLNRLEPYRLRENGRDRWRACCPGHGGKNASALSVGLGDDDAVLLRCFGGCSAEDVARSIGLELADLFVPRAGAQCVSMAPPPAVKALPTRRSEQRTTLDERGAALFAACLPIEGVAADYLRARCCRLPPIDSDLRYHPDLPHPSGYRGPALVARITHVRTLAPMSLHRTWIRSDGTKADVDPPRMLLAGHAKAEGVIRLWPDESVSAVLGIGEGIETMLTMAHALDPVWSLIDAGNLAAFPVLPGITSLTIAADHDPAGRRAADDCARRWAAVEEKTVRVVMSPTAGADLNDHAMAAAA